MYAATRGHPPPADSGTAISAELVALVALVAQSRADVADPGAAKQQVANERCLVAHHEDRAVSVTDDGVGDAAHQSPAHGAKAPAAHHYQGRADLLAQADDLLVGFPGPEVSVHYLRAFRPQLLRPPFEKRLGLAPRLLEYGFPHLRRVRVVAHQILGRRQHEGHVYLRAR